jgi:hypothetical protein
VRVTRQVNDEPPVAIQDQTRVDDGQADAPLVPRREANNAAFGRLFAFAGLRPTNMQV